MKETNNAVTGSLSVPDGADVIFVEPAQIFKVNTYAFFYSKPPTHPQTVNVDPAVTNLFIHTTLPAHTEVLARPFEYHDELKGVKRIHPFLFEVATFTRMADGKMQIVDLGYMQQADLTPTQNLQVLSVPLFTHQPDKQDLHACAECSSAFIASLQAILCLEPDEKNSMHGAELIMQMMKQQNDGTSIVRLYDPETRLPIFVRVQNNYYAKKRNEAAINSRNTAWVYILSKAYSVLAISKMISKASKDRAEDSYQRSFLASYTNHDSSEIAMRILTGVRTMKVSINNVVPSNNPLSPECMSLIAAYSTIFFNEKVFLNMDLHHHLKKLAQLDDCETMTAILMKIAANLEESGHSFAAPTLETCTLYQALRGNHHIVLSLAIYIFILSFYFKDVKLQFDKICNERIYTRKNLQDALLQLKALNPAPPAIFIETLNNYFNLFHDDEHSKRYYFYTGELSSGEYTFNEYKLYQNIKSALENHHLITAETNHDMLENEVPTRSKHIYTITKAYEVETNGKQVFYITLRNPLGPIFAMNNNMNGKVNAQDDNLFEFSIDIAEFVQGFESYIVGKLKTQVELHKAMFTYPHIYEVDIFCIPLEKLKEAQKEQIVTILANKPEQYVSRYLDLQNNIALCELSRLLGDRILTLERSIFSSTDAQSILHEIRTHNAFFKKLNLCIQQRMGATKEQAFTAVNQKHLEKAAELRNSFTANTTDKQELIFNLLHHTTTEINACLAVQSLHDLYEMTRYLEKSIQKKKSKTFLKKDKEAKKITQRHLESERNLLNIVKANFSIRIVSSNTFVTIKANSDTFLYQKHRHSKLSLLKHVMRKFISRTSMEDKHMEMYKHHLKYKAGFRKELLDKLSHVRNIIKFAKEYLTGEKYNDAIPQNNQRLAMLLANSIGIKAKQIASFELSNEGDLYKIVVTTKNAEKKALDVPKETIENYAIAQYNYKQSLLQELRASGHKLETLATEHLKTEQGQEKVIRIINPPEGIKITSYRLSKNRSGYTLTMNINKKYEDRTWVNDWVEDYALAQFNLNRQKVINSGLMHL